jgi:hypothetical protein
MNPRHILRSFLSLLPVLAFAALSACRGISAGTGSPPAPDLRRTPETLSATATPLPASASPTRERIPSPTYALNTTKGIPANATHTQQLSFPASSPTPKAKCNKAAPGLPIDITIQDNTIMYPGQAFTKVWRLLNSGRCKWTTDYSVEWFSGEVLSDTRAVSLGTEVASGDSVDIIVDMVAPLQPGTYQSNWKLRASGKEWFGIGPNGDQVFWVRIVVVQIDTATPTPTKTKVPSSATPTLTAIPTITPTMTLTPTATPVVSISKSVILAAGELLDLDTGEINAGGEDLALQKDETRNHWLAPQGGGVLGVYGSGTPSLQVCLAANMSAAPIPVESLSPGTSLCYRTGQGLTGWLRYDSFNLEGASIELSILTWASP